MEPEPEPEPLVAHRQREILVPVLSQKVDAVQKLCVRWGFGPPSASSIRAPCGLMAIAVARWLASASVAPHLVAAANGGGGLPTVLELLRPLETEELLLPLLDRTAAELLPRREQYIASHAHEFNGDEARQAYRRGLVAPFEVSSWVRNLTAAAVVAPVVFMRHVQCGQSAEDMASAKRFWLDFDALEQDETAMAIERDYVRTEGTSAATAVHDSQLSDSRAGLQCRPSSVRFLVESDAPPATDGAPAVDEPGTLGAPEPKSRHEVQTLEEWLLSGSTVRAGTRRRPKSGTVLLIEAETHRGSQTRHHYHCSWGHFNVLLYLNFSSDDSDEAGRDTLLLLDSMPVDDLPTAAAQAVFKALAVVNSCTSTGD